MKLDNLTKCFKKEKDPVRRPAMLDPVRRYWRGSFFEDLAERTKHRGEKITVDIIQKMDYVGGIKGPYYDREDRWTEQTSDELHKIGYLPGVRVPGYDSLAWYNVPIYVRLLNWQQFDIHAKDEAGNFLYSQDTPSTLHDEMKSNATQEFIKAMFKTSLPNIDIQKIIMIGILGIGAVFGLMMMGVI